MKCGARLNMNLNCEELNYVRSFFIHMFFAFCLRHTLTIVLTISFEPSICTPTQISASYSMQHSCLKLHISPGTHCLVVYFPLGDACILIICGFSFSLFGSDVACINASAIVRSTRNPRHPQARFTDTDQTAAEKKVIESRCWKRGSLSNMFLLKHKCILTLNSF